MKLIVVETPQKADRFRLVLNKAHKILVVPPPLRAPDPDGLVLGEDDEVAERYRLLPERESLVEEFCQLAGQARQIIFATAPGRAGEALAWDLLNCLPEDERVKVQRLALTQLDEDTMRQALEAPGDINPYMVDAWRARQVADRLAHEAVAPQIHRWKLHEGPPPEITLAGMAALRLVVEREWKRHKHNGRRWMVRADLEQDGLVLQAQMNGDLDITRDTEAYALVDLLMEPETSWHIETLEERIIDDSPDPPFTTATLLAASEQELGFTPGQTMQASHDLYDRGLITNPFTTDSRINEKAASSVSRIIRALYGREFLPAEPQPDSDENGADGEAIRPTTLVMHPDLLYLHALTDMVISEDSRASYGLIWQQTVASQMPPVCERVVTATIRPIWTGSVEPWEDPDHYPHPFTFRAELRQMLAEGYRRVYREIDPSGDRIRSAVLMDVLDKGDELRLRHISVNAVDEETPRRYTAAELITELATRGIGHPETYASLVESMVKKGYASLKDGRLAPTPLGEDVLYVCVQHLPEVFRLETAVEVERQLEQVAQGSLSRRKALESFATRLALDTPQPAAGQTGQSCKPPARMEEVAA